MICIGENLEKEELNEQVRSELDGKFIKLSEGFTHYELKGEKGEKTVLLIHGNAAPYAIASQILKTVSEVPASVTAAA